MAQISEVVPTGDLRTSLVAIRDRLAAETDDIKWAKHKRECNCLCGMADIRSLVALSKELRDVLKALDGIPAAVAESDVDRARKAAAAKVDELARKRADRVANSTAS